MKTRPFAEDLFHADTKSDGRTDRHNDANCPFSIVMNACNAYQMIDVLHIKFTYIFVLDRNFETLILVKPGRDRSVTTAKVSSTNQLEPSSHLITSLYF